MKYLMIAFMIGINAQLIFDFNYKSNLEDWRVVDDVVMGGKSSGLNLNLPEDFPPITTSSTTLQSSKLDL